MIIEGINDQKVAGGYFSGDDLFTPGERRRGLPIGNLTSQFFANVYLNGLDHYVQEEVGCGGYVRYVDDFALFDNDPDRLKVARIRVEDYLDGLRLRIHPVKSQIFETKRGACFVGFRVLPDTIRVRQENLRRSRRRLQRYRRAYGRGEMAAAKVTQCLRSWIGHLGHGDTWRLRERIFATLGFRLLRDSSG